MTWDRRLYFPSEGRRAEDFFRPKNPTASAGFEPANLGSTLPLDHWSRYTTIIDTKMRKFQHCFV